MFHNTCGIDARFGSALRIDTRGGVMPGMDYKRRKVDRGQYETVTQSFRELSALLRHARQQAPPYNPIPPTPPLHEQRTWALACRDCGHVDAVTMTLQQLRDDVRAGSIHCTECGVIRKPSIRH